MIEDCNPLKSSADILTPLKLKESDCDVQPHQQQTCETLIETPPKENQEQNSFEESRSDSSFNSAF